LDRGFSREKVSEKNSFFCERIEGFLHNFEMSRAVSKSLIVVACFCIAEISGLKYTLSEKGIPHRSEQSSSIYPFDALAQLSSSGDLAALNEILPSPRTIPELLKNATKGCRVRNPPDIIRDLLEVTETSASILPRLCSFFSEPRSLVFLLEEKNATFIYGRFTIQRITVLTMINIALTIFHVPRISIVLPAYGTRMTWNSRGFRDERLMIVSIEHWLLEKNHADSDELNLEDILPDILMAENTSVYYFGTSKPSDSIRLVGRLRNGVFPAYLTFISPVSQHQDSWMSLVMYVLLHTDL
jgi:hypothetical protein